MLFLSSVSPALSASPFDGEWTGEASEICQLVSQKVTVRATVTDGHAVGTIEMGGTKLFEFEKDIKMNGDVSFYLESKRSLNTTSSRLGLPDSHYFLTGTFAFDRFEGKIGGPGGGPVVAGGGSVYCAADKVVLTRMSSGAGEAASTGGSLEEARAQAEAEARRRYEAELTKLQRERKTALAKAQQEARAQAEAEARERYEVELKKLEEEKTASLAKARAEAGARTEAEVRQRYEAQLSKLEEERTAALAKAQQEARAKAEAEAQQRYKAELRKLKEQQAAALARAEQRARAAALAPTDERTIRNVQTALAMLGHYQGEVDGQFGPASLAAVTAYQSALGAPADGRLTTDQLMSLLLDAQEQARQPAGATASTPEFQLDFGNYHALVIGIDDYQELDKLRNAVADATAVAEVLRDAYGFETTLLTNPTREDILRSVNELRRELTEEDNLIVYYAGHGVIDREVDEGYWLPVDAKRDDNTEWLGNERITRSLRAIQAKHVMVVADSCYSGSLVRGTRVQLKTGADRVEWISRMNERRSRTVLTSGGLEPVVDVGGGGHSVFAKAFLTALTENRGVMEGQELFERLKRPVVIDADQTPVYSDLRKAGHEDGDFLFVRR
ncbi:MAG: caspase family protein [Kiloniellales bacterium]